MDYNDDYWPRKKQSLRMVETEKNKQIENKPTIKWGYEIIDNTKREPRAKEVSPILKEWLIMKGITL